MPGNVTSDNDAQRDEIVVEAVQCCGEHEVTGPARLRIPGGDLHLGYELKLEFALVKLFGALGSCGFVLMSRGRAA